MLKYNEHTLLAIDKTNNYLATAKIQERKVLDKKNRMELTGDLVVNINHPETFQRQKDSLKDLLNAFLYYFRDCVFSIRALDSHFNSYNDLDIRAVAAIYLCIRDLYNRANTNIGFTFDIFDLTLPDLANGKYIVPEDIPIIVDNWKKKMYSFKEANEYLRNYDALVKQEEKERDALRLENISKSNIDKLDNILNAINERDFVYSRYSQSIAGEVYLDYNDELRVIRGIDFKSAIGSKCKSIALANEALFLLSYDGSCKCILSSHANKNHHFEDVNKWSNIKSISCGQYHIVGLKENGTCVSNHIKSDVFVSDNGQCNVSSWSDIKMISCGDYYSAGLKNNGTLVFTGDTSFIPDSTKNAKDIIFIGHGAPESHAFIALDKNGKLYVHYKYWISHEEKNITKQPLTSVEDVVSVAVCNEQIAAVKSDGSMIYEHYTDSYQYNVKRIKDAIAVKADTNCIIVFHKDGSISKMLARMVQKPEYINGLFKDYDQYIEAKRNEQLLLKQEKELQRDRRNKGLCPYCGGTFKKTLFSSVCTSCGKKKDY